MIHQGFNDMKNLSFREYCKEKNLDISGLTKASLNGLADAYIEQSLPTQDDIDELRDIENGVLSIGKSVAQILKNLI